MQEHARAHTDDKLVKECLVQTVDIYMRQILTRTPRSLSMGTSNGVLARLDDDYALLFGFFGEQLRGKTAVCVQLCVCVCVCVLWQSTSLQH